MHTGTHLSFMLDPLGSICGRPIVKNTLTSQVNVALDVRKRVYI